MKQFNLQEYLANPSRQVVTRNGQKVRIVCTDRAGLNAKPVVALITLPNGNEVINSYWEDGIDTRGNKDRNDLFFAPTKHTDYINLYHNQFGYFLGGGVYTSEENAKSMETRDEQYITTIKVEWEE